MKTYVLILGRKEEDRVFFLHLLLLNYLQLKVSFMSKKHTYFVVTYSGFLQSPLETLPSDSVTY